MDNMMEVLNGIECKNFTVVGPVFVNHLLRMNADERVWSKDKFLSKFDWSGVEKIFLPVNGDGRHFVMVCQLWSDGASISRVFVASLTIKPGLQF
ncbi:unnamed protein product [Cuscuta campestris]|uniref:Uncharacterized protein n=1 Tax=Cuscuta campestris TaxID=132261 RepID=A0A484LJG6_9ASTE|nr:unnamed protein product [Cuscuta campestris]